MSNLEILAKEKYWVEKSRVSNAEREYFEKKGSAPSGQCTLVSEIAKAREHIKNSLEKMDGIANLAATPLSSDVVERLEYVEKENSILKDLVENLNNKIVDLQNRLVTVETKLKTQTVAAATAAGKPQPNAPVTTASAADKKNDDDDDDVDLFDSDSEEESAEAAKIREERLKAYAAKKSNKPALIAKSSILLDVKPWDDQTDLKLMEKQIRNIAADGLLWGAAKIVPIAYGVKKLVISCVVEDEKISTDWLTEEIEKMEEIVQSVDIAAFNKI